MRVLIADDDIPFTEFLAFMLRDLGHEVAGIVTSGGGDVTDAYFQHGPDVVLMDFMMPHFNGVTAARQLLAKVPGARVVIMSGMPETDKIQKVAASSGAVGMLRKPFTHAELQTLLVVLSQGPGRQFVRY